MECTGLFLEIDFLRESVITQEQLEIQCSLVDVGWVTVRVFNIFVATRSYYMG